MRIWFRVFWQIIKTFPTFYFKLLFYLIIYLNSRPNFSLADIEFTTKTTYAVRNRTLTLVELGWTLFFKFIFYLFIILDQRELSQNDYIHLWLL